MAFKRSSCSSSHGFRSQVPTRPSLKSLIPRPAQPAPAVQWSALLQACRISFHILPKPVLQKSVWRCQLYLLVRRARPACLGRSTLLARHPGGQNSGARQRLAGGFRRFPKFCCSSRGREGSRNLRLARVLQDGPWKQIAYLTLWKVPFGSHLSRQTGKLRYVPDIPDH